MKEFARTFYKSQAWKKTQAAYKASKGGLCERCLKRGLFVPGIIVHHKTHLTPENIDNPMIALDFDNLELVCRDCHAQEHSGSVRRYKIDELGRVSATA